MLAVAHGDSRKVDLARELDRKYPADPADLHGAWQVIRKGQPELHGEITDQALQRAARDSEHLSMLRSLGLTSALVVPLEARGRVLGTITLAYAESGRHYTESDLGLTQELATRCAIAIDNARVHREAELSRQWLEVVIRKNPRGHHLRRSTERAHRPGERGGGTDLGSTRGRRQLP